MAQANSCSSGTELQTECKTSSEHDGILGSPFLMAVCRICFDSADENGSGGLVSPCACRGSAACVHLDCLREWCGRKGDFLKCDLCHQRYVGPAALELARSCHAKARADNRDDSKSLEAAYHLAVALNEACKCGEAADLHAQTLASYESRLGSEHDNTLAVRSNLALAWKGLGRLEEARQAQEQTLASYRRKRGDDHSHTLTEMNNLALTYCELDYRKEAAVLLRGVYTARARTMGTENPETLVAGTNLASALSKDGAYSESVELFEHCLVSLSRVLGHEHPRTLQTATDLAVALSHMGCHREALERLRPVVDLQRRELGATHSRTLQSAKFLALLEDACPEKHDHELQRRKKKKSSHERHVATAAPARLPHERSAEHSRTSASSEVPRKRLEEAAAPTDTRDSTDPRPLLCGITDTRAKPSEKRARQENDAVLAFIVEAGVPFDEALIVLPLMLEQGFDTLASLQTLTREDLVQFGIKDQHIRRFLMYISQRSGCT
uniref:RING-CH-type domain-containing protein n=1 Tax=Noctiluca scintillans TaxID=2966 RepID=A0A7S1F3P7_NOCSC